MWWCSINCVQSELATWTLTQNISGIILWNLMPLSVSFSSLFLFPSSPLYFFTSEPGFWLATYFAGRLCLSCNISSTIPRSWRRRKYFPPKRNVFLPEYRTSHLKKNITFHRIIYSYLQKSFNWQLINSFKLLHTETETQET